MWFHSLLALWKSGLSRSRRPQPRPARRGTPLVLEHLEDRSLPSSYSAASVSALIADITAANTAGGANTITLTAPTTSPYLLTAVNNNVPGSNPQGPNGLPIIAANDSLTIVGNGDTIDAQQHGRLFDVAAGASLTVENLTLQGGSVEVLKAGQLAAGGGIYNQGTLTLSGVTVQDNVAAGFPEPEPGQIAEGGGICSTGALELENGTVVQNNQVLGSPGPLVGVGGEAFGGGICVAGGTATLSNVSLSSNTAQGGAGENDPGPVASSPYGSQGGAAYGGALAVRGGTVTLTSVTISSNTAQGGLGGNNGTIVGYSSYYWNYGPYGGSGGCGYGGGIYVGSLVGPTATVTLTSVTVTGNDAAGGLSGTPAGGANGYGYGGGLCIISGNVYLDAFTLAHLINNTGNFPPGGPSNIFGTYILT